MSDFEDDYDDDFDVVEYFYVEETYDEVGDLAEHAVASPPPVDYDEDDWDWDRFHYWNDIEYDSDGYHDVDTERTARVRQKRAALSPKDLLKRRIDTAEGIPSKRRKRVVAEGLSSDPAITDTLGPPISWRQRDEKASTPIRSTSVTPFALLRDWRNRFPESKMLDGDSDLVQENGPLEIELDPDALLTALRVNLSNITGGASAAQLGVNEQTLLQHITRMLAEEGASADDIAGELADALFARDDTSVASEVVDEKKGDGEFGQWVLNQAKENLGADQQQNPPTVHQQGSLTADAQGSSAVLHASPKKVLMADGQPPTPSPTEIGGSQKVLEDEPARLETRANPASRSTNLRSKKRKADTENHVEDLQGASKRVATRSFDALTASSQAKKSQATPASRRTTRNTSKNLKR